MEPVDPQQQQLPVHQPEVDRPVGAGRVDPLRCPASSQVPAILVAIQERPVARVHSMQTQTVRDIARVWATPTL